MKVCADCAIAAVNADYSGMDADTETRVRIGLSRVGNIVIDTDNYHEFSWSPCECCGTILGGSRYDATVI